MENGLTLKLTRLFFFFFFASHNLGRVRRPQHYNFKTAPDTATKITQNYTTT